MIRDVVADNDFMKLRDKSVGWRSSPSPLKPSPTHRLLKKLEALRKTPEEERWPDADWPDAQAFEDAREFVLGLPLASIPLPDFGLANDGEINFLWKNDDVHVDLGFTHTFSYFAQGEDGEKMYGEEVPVSEGLPAKIIALLAA